MKLAQRLTNKQENNRNIYRGLEHLPACIELVKGSIYHTINKCQVGGWMVRKKGKAEQGRERGSEGRIRHGPNREDTQRRKCGLKLKPAALLAGVPGPGPGLQLSHYSQPI